MFCCRTCGKELCFPSVILNEDLDATTVGLCSPACQDIWYDTILKRDTPSTKVITADGASTSVNINVAIRFRTLGAAA